jgi:predicted 2-oxoglutarate/Fe(II)-dependent dioxygenase YbiX
MAINKPEKPVIEKQPWLQNDNLPFLDIENKRLRCQIDSYRFLLSQLVGKHYNTFVYPNFSDIVVWRTGMYMDFHKDDGNEGPMKHAFAPRKYSMIAYLNDNYVSGETVVRFEDGSEYTNVPKKGSVFFFKANEECLHKVNAISKGTRYTYAIWFATNAFECECVDSH